MDWSRDGEEPPKKWRVLIYSRGFDQPGYHDYDTFEEACWAKAAIESMARGEGAPWPHPLGKRGFGFATVGPLRTTERVILREV